MANQDGHEGHKRALHRAKGLVAKDVAIKKKAFLRYATGSIENTSVHEFSYLVVKIDLFDANGKLVGNVGDGVQNFRPSQMWNFEAAVSSEEVATARVSEIKGWH